MSGLPSSDRGGSDAEDGNLRSLPLLFQSLEPGPARDAAEAQLAGGGEDPEVVRSWCRAGAVYALVDVGAGPGAPYPAAAVVVPRPGGTLELAVLVTTGGEWPDLTRRMLAEVCDALRRGDASRLTVATTNAEVPLMAILQEAGFRFKAVERDGQVRGRGLSPAVVGGLAARDLVWFDQSL